MLAVRRLSHAPVPFNFFWSIVGLVVSGIFGGVRGLGVRLSDGELSRAIHRGVIWLGSGRMKGNAEVIGYDSSFLMANHSRTVSGRGVPPSQITTALTKWHIS